MKVERNYLRMVWATVLSLVLSMPLAPLRAQSLICEPGYVIGFYNGVSNTWDEANDSLLALKSAAGTAYNGKIISYELFYNFSEGLLRDMAETFIQRANQLNDSGSVSTRLELLWDAITGGGGDLWDRLANITSSAGELLRTLRDYLFDNFRTEFAGAISRLLVNPPTQIDEAEHASRINELISQGQRILFVGHSQGNLFIRAAFNTFSTQTTAGSMGAVHVAPPFLPLPGEYVLADIDTIIRGLRLLQGAGTVPTSNIVLPFSARDWTGHAFVQTYLDPSRAARQAVTQRINAALGRLIAPNIIANIGFFTITLQWNGTGDVDLHVFEPNGTHVFYNNKQGVSGRLDVDNTRGFGPEHYYSTCNPANLQLGTYRIGINNYNDATGRIATVQAASVNTGVLKTETLGVGPELGSAGNNSPIPVMNVIVSRNQDGVYEVRAQ